MAEIKILTRAEHGISRKSMPDHVLKVLYRLKSKGYLGLLVGGALRDLLRGREPRDFDVATDAPLEEIRTLFRNSKTIGKRFPIIHAYFGNEVVEISSLKGEEGQQGMELVLADATRRDFTANAIFYNIDEFQLIDPLDAIPDVIEGRVVCIGDPDDKFTEDPVRLLRALKLVAKQGFVLEDRLDHSLRAHAAGVVEIGPGRKYEELTRILMDRHGTSILALCQHYGILKHLWPQGSVLLSHHGLAFFDGLREQTPVNQSRGSFAKHSHTYLWLRLYLDSPFFKPVVDEDFHKAQFDQFIDPLATPFRAPIVDSAMIIAHMLSHPDGRQTHRVSKEVHKLVQTWLEQVRPAVAEAFYQHFCHWEKKERSKEPRSGGRSRRRRRGRGGRRRRGGAGRAPSV